MSNSLRAPRFAVVTNLMVALGLIAVGLKIGSKFLPENQPNRLSVEYSSYVRDADRQKINWYAFSQEPFSIAKTENKLVFLELGTAVSQNSQILTRQYYQDEEFVRFLNDHFISIRCDIDEMPWVAEAIEPNSSSWGELDNCLLVVLDADGNVIEASQFRPLRMDRDPGGIYEWVSSIVAKSIDNPKLVIEEANQNSKKNQNRAQQYFRPGPDNQSVVSDFVSTLCNSLSSETGALVGGITPVSATIPALLLSAGTQLSVSKSALFLLRMRESECYDQLEGGFFVGSKLSNWIFPRYGKYTLQNATLAETYARAGVFLQSPIFKSTAIEIISYLNKYQWDTKTYLYFSGSYADDEPLGFNPFYDSSINLPEGVSHYKVREKQNKKGPMSIAPVPLSDVATDTVWSLIRTEKSLLGSQRDETKRPRIMDSCYANVNGAVISSLFRIGVLLDNSELISKAQLAYSAACERFLSSLGDVNHAIDGRARVTGYLGDFVWIARASIDNYNSTGNIQALENAKRIALRIQDLFDCENGGFYYALDSFLSFAGFFETSIVVSDEDSESLCAVTLRMLSDFAQMTRNSELIKRNTTRTSQITGNVPLLQVQATGLVRAMQRQNMPVIVVNDSNPKTVPEISRELPNETVLRADPSAFANKPGIYIMLGESLTGPIERKQLTQTLLAMKAKLTS